jgi:hypothetical protein
MTHRMITTMAVWTHVCCAVLLGGCTGPPLAAAGITAAVSVSSIPILQRTPLDAIYSVATGQDCSLVRLDQGLTYCRPVEPLPAPPPFCSRSLAGVDCWRDPALLANRPHELADGPRVLTASQEAYRLRRWPMF